MQWDYIIRDVLTQIFHADFTSQVFSHCDSCFSLASALPHFSLDRGKDVIPLQSNQSIDSGRAFDWGRASSDYAKYRDIYPQEFYQKILSLGLCRKGQKVLDLGTGTGVLPRNLYPYGAQFIGTDISENQIREARRLSKEAGMQIDYLISPAEELNFPPNTFDTITACQCFFYFDPVRLLPRLANMLKPGGRLGIFYMAWLPEEDPIAEASEDLILQYNPLWSGRGETRRPIPLPSLKDTPFSLENSLLFDLQIPFTRESWNGRIKTCRGIGASLSEERCRAFEQEHLALLQRIAPPQFDILHYAAMAVLKRRL